MNVKLVNKNALWKFLLPAIAISVNAAFISSLMWGSNSIYTWSALKDKKNVLSQELAELNKQRSNLSREIRLLKADPAYVEKIIRQRLNYVRKNEILYLFDNEQQKNAFWSKGEAHAGNK
ncbi:MAG: septum formation initiator family protein [Mailhella sp.]|nr:septum formation initiator family protein [Mailhella sp.]